MLESDCRVIFPITMNCLSGKYLKNALLTSINLFSNSLFLSSVLIFTFNAFPALGFQLNFSGSVTGDLTDPNLTDNIGATMRFSGVDPDNNIDLVITAIDAYNPNNPSNNGAIGDNDGRINMPRNSSTTFRFSFVETGTNNPFTVGEADMGLYDIDGGDSDGSMERE